MRGYQMYIKMTFGAY